MGAALVGGALRTDLHGLASRSLRFAELLTEGFGAGAAFQLFMEVGTGNRSRLVILGALIGSAAFQIAVADVASLVKEQRLAPIRLRSADLAIVTSGTLMAVGYGGLAGDGRLGLWGPLLFSIPLLATWYSLELLRRTRRTFRQTVRALAVAPELGGLVRPGHVEHVADLAVSLGRELGLSPSELDDLETAAWLHHLGSVCLDDPVADQQTDPAEVARAGARMLRSSHALARAGDIVGAEPSLHRAPDDSPSPASALLGQILKVASAYDELTGGDEAHAAWAVDALFTGPAYVYDGRVLTALERVLGRSAALTP
jgi:hypothetical protein